jgi:hypothetical protein
MTVKVSTVHPMTRQDARDILARFASRPDTIDFSRVRTISHCFADELFSHLPASTRVLNASPFVQRILSSVR